MCTPLASVCVMATSRFRHIEFEIYGRVQNVWMRKHVIDAGKFFGVTGYCFNTDNTTPLPSQNPSRQKCTGTVRGEACGELEAVESFEEYIKGRWKAAEPVRLLNIICIHLHQCTSRANNIDESLTAATTSISTNLIHLLALTTGDIMS